MYTLTEEIWFALALLENGGVPRAATLAEHYRLREGSIELPQEDLLPGLRHPRFQVAESVVREVWVHNDPEWAGGHVALHLIDNVPIEELLGAVGPITWRGVEGFTTMMVEGRGIPIMAVRDGDNLQSVDICFDRIPGRLGKTERPAELRSLADELRDLLALQQERGVTSDDLIIHFTDRIVTLTNADAGAEPPWWTESVRPNDVLIELGDSAVCGIRVTDLGRNGGCDAQLSVVHGKLEELEDLLGKLDDHYPSEDDLSGRMTASTHVAKKGFQLDVAADHYGPVVSYVTVKFPKRRTATSA